MRNGKILLLAFCAMLSFAPYAADAQNRLTIEDINNGSYAPKGIRNITPMLDGEHYTQMSADRTKIIKYSFRTGKEVETVFDVNTARECKIDKFDGYIFSPDEKKILIRTMTKPVYRNSYTAVYYLFDVKNNKMKEFTSDEIEVPVFSPDGNLLAYVKDNNIYLVKFLYGNAVSQVTKDGEYNKIKNGTPDWVYEEEFAFNSALTFSPDSKMIAYIKWNESEVPSFSFPLYKGLAPEMDQYAEYPGEYTYKYPVAGEVNSKVTVNTFDIFTKVTKTMQLPVDKDVYIPRIKFTDNPEKLAVMTLNRNQNRLDIYYANPKTGVCQLVLRDEDKHYIKENAYSDIKFYENNIGLISERDGYAHLYWYTIGGNLVKQVTKGNFEVTDFYGWDENTNTFYYASNEGSPLTSSIWKIDAKNKKTKLSSGEEGTNNAVFSETFKYYINSFSNINTPNLYTINDNNGKVLATLMDNSELKERVAGTVIPQKEFFKFTTPENVELNGWMIKPEGFDASRKYPVLMYQYSGPGSQQVLNKWGISWENYLATQGYVVVCVDGRGTGGRGAEFEKCTYMNIGVKEADDQVYAAKYLGSLPYVDKDRIGIWGWSYGGYMTLMSMSQGSDVFKAGIAVAAPTDWRYYDTVYTERFMRTPQENGEGYDKSSAFSRAGKLHGRLLLVHGTADDNVHLRNMAEYTEKLVQLGIDFDMMVYTNRNHSIAGGNTRNHLYNKLTKFLKENL